MSKKIIAQRVCIACRKVQNKYDMIRIARSQDGEIKIDPSGKSEGRGAYLCKNVECLKIAIKRRQLDRAFKIKIPNDIYSKINVECGMDNEDLINY